MIKVIVSHDVDHLFARDHWFRDLFYPKLWVRTTLQMFRRELTYKEWLLRNTSCFRRNIHNLDILMDFDERHGIPSTFFFGMNQGLGMSYNPKEAKPVIKNVHERGFAVGVHGIEYRDPAGMKNEYDTFRRVAGFEPCGIRMHYVRFDEKTFEKLNDIGYAFDTTEFDKANCGTRKAPYQVGNMWEFPLAIMDSYMPKSFEAARESTLKLLDQCKEQNLQVVTVLFHDYHYCEDYLDMKRWYEWLMEYFFASDDYSFSSFKETVEALEINKTRTSKML